uniref:Putative conserved secreted protein n=1 Tax=Amblyomma tuberculatum TaxID=48802 RepID=A0A6M2E287_9ACAR
MLIFYVIFASAVVTEALVGIWEHKSCLAFCRPRQSSAHSCKGGCVCHPMRYFPFVGGCLDPTLTAPFMFRPRLFGIRRG